MNHSTKAKRHLKHIWTLALTLLLVPQILLSESNSYEWGMRKEDVLSKYLNNAEYTSFTPASKPEYENKILNFILAINSDMKDRILIVRSSSVPQRDYLLINNKLYSVLENYGTLPNAAFEKIITDLSAVFKSPNIQKDKNMVTYSFYGKETKVLVLSYQKQSIVDCKVYHYPSKLFKILITE